MTERRKISQEELDKLLKYDALHDAEKMTGGDSADPKSIAHHLGIQNFFENKEKKKEALHALDDTTYHEPLSRYLRIAREIGFEVALEVPFKGSMGLETFYVLWRRGVLLYFDTYDRRTQLNGGSFWYNWEPAQGLQEAWRYTSSGGYARHGESRVWVGHHDCREALRHHISQLEVHGKFLENWEEQGYLQLLHHGDENDLEQAGRPYDLDRTDRITKSRIALLPEHVRKAISPDLRNS
jgi:hypothetical protein